MMNQKAMRPYGGLSRDGVRNVEAAVRSVERLRDNQRETPQLATIQLEYVGPNSIFSGTEVNKAVSGNIISRNFQEFAENNEIHLEKCEMKNLDEKQTT